MVDRFFHFCTRPRSRGATSSSSSTTVPTTCIYTVDTYEQVQYFTDRANPLRRPADVSERCAPSRTCTSSGTTGAAHEYELYDLDKDPYELENLFATDAGEQANAALVDKLHARLVALTACSGPSCRS